MARKLLASLLAVSMGITLLAACVNKGPDPDETQTSKRTTKTTATQQTEDDHEEPDMDPDVENESSDTEGTEGPVSTESTEGSESTEQPESQLGPMTSDEIRLSYAAWGQHEKGEPEARNAQLAAFMEEYPNIQVEFVEIDQPSWDDTLYNLAAVGELPDVFWVFNVLNAVRDQWALDVTELYEQDPDTSQIYEGIREISQLGGKRFHMPGVMFPHVMIMNKTLFDQYNVEMPEPDWTIDEFKELAVELSHPEDYNFGTSQPIYYDLNDAWYEGTTRYGWDGHDYHLGEHWVDAWNLRLDWIDQKVVEWMNEEEKEEILGDPVAWPPGKGRSAMHIDWPWTIALFEDVVSEETGHEFVYYPLPSGPSGSEMAIVDNSIISNTTEYPREAWELQKWTSWGKEATINRIKGYEEADAPTSRLPVINDPELWDMIVEKAPDHMKVFYAHMPTVNMVPSPWPIAPGWGEFEAWMGEEDIIGRIERRELKPEDIVAELNTKANEFKEQWLQDTDLDY